MRLSRLYMTLILVLTAAVVSPAGAQYDRGTKDRISQFNIRTGVFFPQGDTVNNSEWMVGAEYEFPAAAVFGTLAGRASISADYTRIETARDEGTTRASLVPVFINWKSQLAGTDRSFWDLGVGVGFYWVQRDIPEMRLSEGTKFAYQAMATYHFTPSYFIEGRFLGSAHPGDDGMFGLAVGYSF